SPSASASASAGRRSKRDAGPPPIEPVERRPDGPSCVALAGSPAAAPSRTLGRPACRGAEVLEWRDSDGAPRYACVVAPPDLEKKKPLPLVLYLHGETP